MIGLALLMTMIGTKKSKNSDIYGFWPENKKISGFLPFPVSPHLHRRDFFGLKASLSKDTIFEQIKKVRTRAQHDEIDEIKISPYTKCMVAIFGRKILST